MRSRPKSRWEQDAPILPEPKTITIGGPSGLYEKDGKWFDEQGNEAWTGTMEEFFKKVVEDNEAEHFKYLVEREEWHRKLK